MQIREQLLSSCLARKYLAFVVIRPRQMVPNRQTPVRHGQVWHKLLIYGRLLLLLDPLVNPVVIVVKTELLRKTLMKTLAEWYSQLASKVDSYTAFSTTTVVVATPGRAEFQQGDVEVELEDFLGRSSAPASV